MLQEHKIYKKLYNVKENPGLTTTLLKPVTLTHARSHSGFHVQLTISTKLARCIVGIDNL